MQSSVFVPNFVAKFPCSSRFFVIKLESAGYMRHQMARHWQENAHLLINAHLNAEPKKSQLPEMFNSLGLFVAVSGFDFSVEKQVTMHNVGLSPAATVKPANFGQIDLVLVGRKRRHKVSSVSSCMDMSLASHYLPIIAGMDLDLPKAIATTSRDPRFHLSQVPSGCASPVFATTFHECVIMSF